MPNYTTHLGSDSYSHILGTVELSCMNIHRQVQTATKDISVPT